MEKYCNKEVRVVESGVAVRIGERRVLSDFSDQVSEGVGPPGIVGAEGLRSFGSNNGRPQDDSFGWCAGEDAGATLRA
jgi:hypothetical protein